jgi:hypothetical protein
MAGELKTEGLIYQNQERSGGEILRICEDSKIEGVLRAISRPLVLVGSRAEMMLGRGDPIRVATLQDLMRKLGYSGPIDIDLEMPMIEEKAEVAMCQLVHQGLVEQRGNAYDGFIKDGVDGRQMVVVGGRMNDVRAEFRAIEVASLNIDVVREKMLEEGYLANLGAVMLDWGGKGWRARPIWDNGVEVEDRYTCGGKDMSEKQGNQRRALRLAAKSFLVGCLELKMDDQKTKQMMKMLRSRMSKADLLTLPVGISSQMDRDWVNWPLKTLEKTILGLSINWEWGNKVVSESGWIDGLVGPGEGSVGERVRVAVERQMKMLGSDMVNDIGQRAGRLLELVFKLPE